MASTMNFFTHKHRAKAQSKLLVIVFACSVFAVIIISHYAITFMNMQMSHPWQDPETFFTIALCISVVIGLGALYKFNNLKGGGSLVASSLGGRYVSRSTQDSKERMFVNCVDEMAIASGTPVPMTFVLDHESGINAFAAGHDIHDAAIAISRGALDKLNRNEIQGVVAHEFSHILNGDMALNMKLTGFVHGLLMISLAGYILTRSLRFSRKSYQGVAIGLALIIVGYFGVLISRIIKAAISRQREYLADASAVQFTRNPSGIAGALKKIGRQMAGGRIRHPKAEEASHMFIANHTTYFEQVTTLLTSTHPPLEERIRRIDPSFDGDFDSGITLEPPPATVKPKPSQEEPLNALDVVAPILMAGQVTETQIEASHHLIQHLPYEVIESLNNGLGCEALLFGLLINEDEKTRKQQMHLLYAHGQYGLDQELRKLKEPLKRIPRKHYLCLVELALAGLRKMPRRQYTIFKDAFMKVIELDKSISVFEFILYAIVFRELDITFSIKPKNWKAPKKHELINAAGTLLSIVAFAGQDNPAKAKEAFDHCWKPLGSSDSLTFLNQDEASITALHASLKTLQYSEILFRQRVLESAEICIKHDETITLMEYEIVRAIAAYLDVPISLNPEECQFLNETRTE